MKVNIERAIKSIAEKIDFYQPLCEFIVNSFQASATEVNLVFDVDENNNVVGYSVQDNGEGYTSANIDSFLEFWSEYKIEQYALGSGRILCLKVFDDIIIESQTKDSDKECAYLVKIKFNKNFSANYLSDVDSGDFDEIRRTKKQSNLSETTTTFLNINKDYKIEKDSNVFNEKYIEDKILIDLLPMFIEFEKNTKIFNIKINGKTWLNQENLKKIFKEFDFKDEKFTIDKEIPHNGNKKPFSCDFNLKYRITKDYKREIIQFYGAADRFIRRFPKGTALSSLKEGYSGIFCLTSEYFNSRVKDSRKDFHIPMNQSNSTLDDPITFPEINEKLTDKLNDILRANFEGIDDELHAKKYNVIKKSPHLYRYVDKIDNLTINEHEIAKIAEEDYLKELKIIREELTSFTDKLRKDKSNFNKEKYKKITDDFTQIGREQLADYIGYRQTIIDMLLEIYSSTQVDNKSFIEGDIHNLFMPKRNTSDTISKYANNVWIFDDKFMSYTYTASDMTIANIVEDVTGKPKEEIIEHHQRQKPDLILFYSDEEDAQKDVLLIEFKRLNHEIEDKKKAITQLQDYPMYIRKNIKNVRTIFSYAILDFDKPFREWLTDSQGFSRVAFGVNDDNISAYYRYNETVMAHLNVLSFSQVLEDAKKRNKTFLDILIQNFEDK